MEQIAKELKNRRNWVTMPLEGKKPIIKDWAKLTTIDYITSWNKGNNIGLICGALSGIVVLDIDNKDGGMDDWAQHVKKYGEPETLKVITGGGGLHYYFRYNERVSHLKSSSRVAINDEGKTMAWDIKSNGGQVVIPPSIHPVTGKGYDWDNFTEEIIEMPDWIFTILTRPRNNVQKRVQAKAIIINDGPSGFSGFECVGILPDSPTTIPKITYGKSNEGSEVNYEIKEDTLKELLELLSDERAINYDDWCHVIWALRTICETHKDPESVRELAHEFSQRCPDKYNAEAVDKKWDEGKVGELTMGSLMHYLKEDIGEKQYEDFKLKHRVAHKLLTLQIQTRYDPFDSYYLHDYISWVNTCKVFENHGTMMNTILPNLKRVARVICNGKPVYYFKESADKLFSPHQLYPRAYDHIKFLYKSEPNENGETKTLNMPCLLPLLNDTSLFDREITWIPYHKDTPVKIPSGVFNIFPGFRAKLVPNFNTEEYKKIEPLLAHIFIVWAKKNPEYYYYILSWLAHPFRTLTKTNKVLVLTGSQGIGKTIIFDFMSKFVYGSDLSFSCAGLDLVTQRFNSASSGKMLYTVNEIDAADNHSQYMAKFTKFKEYITGDKIAVERKGIDTEQIANHCNYVICSNNPYPVVAEMTDRRFPIFDCSDELRGNTGYFSNLGKLFTQEIGDLFYTYLRSDIFGKDILRSLDPIPMTEARANAIEASQPRVVTFQRDFFFNGEQRIPEVYLHKIDNRPFITTESLYELYKDWFRTNNPNGKIRNREVWSKEFKANCQNVESSRRWIQVPQRAQKMGYFLTEPLYDSTTVQIDAYVTLTLRQWLTN